MTRSGRFLPQPAPAATIPAPMDLDHGSPVPPRRAVPRRVPGLARGATCRGRPCRRATPARASPRTSSGSARSSTPATPSCRGPREYGGREAQPLGVADLRGGVLPRRRAAARHAERHLPARADDLRVRHAGAEGPHPAARWRRANRRGARAGRSRTRAAISPASSSKARARRRRAAAGGSSGQKTWTTRGAFCTHLFGLFRSDPEAERHRGLTYFLVDLATPGVTVRPVERLDGDEGFAEVFLDDVFVPDADVLGEPNQGWARRDGDDRLRARPHAALPRPVPGDRATAHRPRYHARGDDPTTRARPPRRRVDRRRGVPLADVLDRHPHRRGRARRARSRAW